MKYKLILCFLVLLELPGLAPGALGADQEEEWPPRNNGFNLVAKGVGLMQTGPEGVGLGLGYAFWDLGKEERNLYLLGMFADTPYRTFLLDYSEPGLFRDGDRLRFTAFYQLRPATHFFGIGPDREMEDGAYYQRQNYLYAFTYGLPLWDHFGMSAGIGYYYPKTGDNYYV